MSFLSLSASTRLIAFKGYTMSGVFSDKIFLQLAKLEKICNHKGMKFLAENERAIILDCMHKKQDSRIYKRLHVIILYDDGLSVAKIARLFYLDEETIRSYIECT